MKKGGILRNFFDTIRPNQSGQGGRGGTGPNSERAAEFGGKLKAEHFSLCQVARHGFPECPTALAFDPVQRISAIGTKSGAVRIFGRPSVEVWAEHESSFPVTHMKFIVNQGALITVTADDSIHLWSLRGPNLKLQLSSSGGGQTSSSPAPPAGNAGGGGGGSSSSGSGPQSGGSSSSAAAVAASLLGHNTDSANDVSDYLADQLTPSPTSGLDPSIRQPEVLHTLKFQREHITFIHQTVASKWLYIGTERGNVHVVNVETFELSGYQIAWNKAIELSRKNHPGSIIHISECPQDNNKLLIGFESGCIVLWDLKGRNADGRYYHTDNLLSLDWHHEGKQFVAAHGDGSLITWQTRSNAKPVLIQHPHAKTLPPGEPMAAGGAGDLRPSPLSLASSFARSLNNELYRPINKVEWKTARNNERFLLFSGGLPYDGLEGATDTAAATSGGGGGIARAQSSQQQLQPSAMQLKSSSVSPNSMLMAPTSGSGSISPGGGDPLGQKYSKQARKSLRLTSLTVMFGQSITVLELEQPIIDFITVCDNSPYNNDTSDPLFVIVLLANGLELIDLTSSGYPTYTSPYPSVDLNESPVTCIEYLADCSIDLFSLIYSNSQDLMSRVPKKGYSDKKWPINGGECGRSTQSNFELVITGHADGSIKFWNMNGVNFDLLSDIKTASLFEPPHKLANSVLVPNGGGGGGGSGNPRRQQQRSLGSNSPAKLAGAGGSDYGGASCGQAAGGEEFDLAALAAASADFAPVEDYLAIEKIEFNSQSKHLLVAGALAQVIQFRLNRPNQTAAGGGGGNEIATILVDPQVQQTGNSSSENSGNQVGANISGNNGSNPTNSSGSSSNNNNNNPQRQHHLLKVRSERNVPGAATSGGAGSSSSASNKRVGGGVGGYGGFQVELVCLTPLLVTSDDCHLTTAEPASKNITHYCLVPPKVTALQFQATHNILAYAHENGIVLVDIIQKCVIINANLGELYGGASSLAASNRDISIQPYATSSILQHHYSQTGASPSLSSSAAAAAASTAEHFGNKGKTDNGSGATSALQGKQSLGAGSGAVQIDSERGQDNGAGGGPATIDATDHHDGGAKVGQSPSSRRRFAPANSMFQRQFSTNALVSGASSQPPGQPQASGQPQGRQPPRIFQRQMTASQLFSSSNASADASPLSGGPAARAQRRLVDSLVQQQPASASPSSQQPPGAAGEELRRAPKNKRIISRMLSISAIHTSATGSGESAIGAGGVLNGGAGEGYQAGDFGPNGSEGQQQQADKFDSSFHRSRSSSGSSYVAPNEAALSGGSVASSKQLEAIQCLCFLEWPSGVSSSTTASGPTAGQSSSACVTSGAGNHKSPNDPLGDAGLAAAASGQLSLWLGTSSGCVLLVQLQMPDSEDNRVLQLQSVNAEPIPGAAVRLPGAILCLSPFAAEASPRQPSQGLNTGSQGSSLEGDASSSTPPPADALGQAHQSEASASSSFDARHGNFLAIVSEKEARVYQIPSLAQLNQQQQQHHSSKSTGGSGPTSVQELYLQACKSLLTSKHNCVGRIQISDSSFACRSALVQMRQPDESCLVSYLATGNLIVHSLPKLRPLMEADFVPYSSGRISQSMQFACNGHCLYQPSAREIQKVTLSSRYKSLVAEMIGSLYVPREMPEMPRANFFKSLFSVASSTKQSDRDELFGECSSGKPSRGVAMHLGTGTSAGPSAMDKLKGAAVGTMGYELRMAREGLDERGEKLSKIEDKTLHMLNSSETFSQSAHQLAQKAKDKKWYQI